MGLVMLFIICWISVGGATHFDWDVGNTSAWLSAGAYCPPNTYLNRTYIGFSEGFIPTDAINDEESDTQGYIGYHSGQKKIFVVFRGSTSIVNWIEDMDAFQVPYHHHHHCDGCEVHEGFHYAEQMVISQVETAVKNLKSKFPKYDVVITGHSLGAALASLTALDLLKAKIEPVILMNFGSPRFGNKLLAQYASEQLKSRYRVTHLMDPVPHCPFQFDFTHISGEWYEREDGSLLKCAANVFEDEHCANQWYLNLFGVDDHMEYLGVTMGCSTD